ncbi:MAG TPA: hypothetical protein VFR34_11905 [Paracoccaceae bacterium]|nr:hypothetical protein [Paracoccaceae bacterium]
MRPALLTLLAPLLAAACAAPYGIGGSVYNTDVQRQLYGPGYPVLGGTQKVFMYGTPPAGLTPEGFAALMRAPQWFQPTRFEAAQPGERPGSVRFVTAFGTDTNIVLCSRPAPGGDPALIAMAYCYGDREVTRASMRLTPGGDIARDVSALMYGLLPPPRPDDTHENCRIPGGC